jgi:hypothetical protein
MRTAAPTQATPPDGTARLRHGRAAAGPSVATRSLATAILAAALCFGVPAASEAQTPDDMPCVAEPTPECLSREALTIYDNAPVPDTDSAGNPYARIALPFVLAATRQHSALEKQIALQGLMDQRAAAFGYAASGQLDRVLVTLENVVEEGRSNKLLTAADGVSACDLYAPYAKFYSAYGEPEATKQINKAYQACLRAEWGMFGWLRGLILSSMRMGKYLEVQAELLYALDEASDNTCPVDTTIETVADAVFSAGSGGLEMGIPPPDSMIVLVDCARQGKELQASEVYRYISRLLRLSGSLRLPGDPPLHFDDASSQRHFSNLIEAWAEAPEAYHDPIAEQHSAGAAFYKMLAHAPEQDVPELTVRYLLNMSGTDPSTIEKIARAFDSGSHSDLVDWLTHPRDLTNRTQWRIWSLTMIYAASAGDRFLLETASEAGLDDTCPSIQVGAVYRVTARVLAENGHLDDALTLLSNATCDEATFYDRADLILRSGDKAALRAAVHEAYSLPDPAQRYDHLVALAYALVRTSGASLSNNTQTSQSRE